MPIYRCSFVSSVMDYKFLSLLLVLSSSLVICTNVETSNAIIYRGSQAGSYFGYSVNLYRYQNNPSFKFALVGAPRANSSSAEFETGNTFRCNALDPASCTPLTLTGLSDPNLVIQFGDVAVEVEDKTTMWMGGTVVSSYQNGEVLTCGHRYFDTNFRREPVGRCYLLPNPMGAGETLSPCNTGNCPVFLSGTGHCLSGMSAHILSDGSQIYLGAPGYSFYRGTLIRGKADTGCTEGFLTENAEPFGYIGYAITSGRLLNRDSDAIVVSSPRQTLHQGNLHVVRNDTSTNLDQILTLRGTSQDTYYGYSMLTVDLDGDGLDELLVSAPIYSAPGLPEIGQVLLYRNTGTGPSTTPVSYIQQFRYGRFGTALADLGDLDKDGFPDIAISAPYGDQAGTVFIYSGLATGLLSQTPKQVIRGEDVGLPVGSAFGISISGKQDIDDNGYNDMLVGAYLNDSAVLLRTLPVISVSVLTASTPMFAVISLADARALGFSQNITYDSVVDMEHSFFTLNLRLSFSSPAISTDNLMLNFSINSDQDRANSRVFFVQNASASRYYRDVISLTKGVVMDLNVLVYINDLSTEPYTFDFSYSAINPTPFNFNTSVFITNLGAVPRFSVQPDVMCGDDRICTPILVITANAILPTQPDSNTRYTEIVQGLVPEVTISIKAKNVGEDSFGTRMELLLPTGLTYRIANVENQELVIGCQNTEQAQIGSFTCSPLGRPFTRDQVIQFSVVLNTDGLVGNEGNVTIQMTLVSDNPNPNASRSNFSSNVTIAVSAIADITVALEASPNRLSYNETTELRIENLIDTQNGTLYSHSNLGPEIIFTITVRNEGPSSISNSTILVHWPLGISVSGDESVRDFYLYISRIDSSTIQCDQFFVNLRDLRTEVVIIDEGDNAGIGGRRRRSVRGKKRRRRQSSILSPSVNTEINQENSPLAYVNFGCQAGRLSGGEEADVQIVARIFEPTLVTNAPDAEWTFSVSVLGIIGDSYVDQPPTHSTDSSETIVTAVPSSVTQAQEGFTLWWVIVLAVGAFVALLIPIFIVLYFAGFFRKSKTKKAREEFEGKVKEWNETKPDFK